MAITFQYCSDLHLEMELNKRWVKKYPLIVKGDILLLSGDILLLNQMDQHSDFLDQLSENFKAVYWIPGNHEYYLSENSDAEGSFKTAVRDNVFLLNNKVIEIDDLALICTTLWSKIDPLQTYAISRSMNDFRHIKKDGHPLTVAGYNEWHERDLDFLKAAIARYDTCKKIVMTHHVPTFMNYPRQYAGDILNQAFATELYDLIEQSGVSHWLFGHTHCNTPEFSIGTTRLLTNQLGYVRHGEHNTFSRECCFTVN